MVTFLADGWLMYGSFFLPIVGRSTPAIPIRFHRQGHGPWNLDLAIVASFMLKGDLLAHRPTLRQADAFKDKLFTRRPPCLPPPSRHPA
ncbi:hypothetical protein [Azohydromonas lata]|uniref:Uncharacterized protein n=1 Tax=Azohydromonas lata TaxID=45677 RepID=A0ABU5IAL3_9BURK|nr:hypothetical protein [Azohydromonas lata]MDZ5455646.1 hypothetical protein [Azohydromonas lata]